MLKDGLQASHGASEELEEVELELSKKQDIEAGTDDARNENNTNDGATTEASENNADINVAKQVLLQAFTLTFLAEWGDRSQIATIALATHLEPIGVTIGGCMGHALCTGLAVIGGKLLASRISERTVLLSGGALFLVFAIAGLIFGPQD